MTNTLDKIRKFWDEDASVYDHGADHVPQSAAEQAAWSAALLRLLPPPPASVLDVGAGTGFLSLALARLGYRVTALDLSPGMLARLDRKAEREAAEVETVQGPAHEPPGGPFDAVVERNVVWTLPDPAAALAAWRTVAPGGRLVLLEGLWGERADIVERARGQARSLLHRVRGHPSGHHGSYDEELLGTLPLAAGPDPERLSTLVEPNGWGPARVERLRDVEWASSLTLPPLERLLGVHARFAVVAGSAT
ncbi:MAG: class I SAM-dependent methyltransferase [Streptosporangiaceae bacterium]